MNKSLLTPEEVQAFYARLQPAMRSTLRQMLQGFREAHACSLHAAAIVAAMELQRFFDFSGVHLMVTDQGQFRLAVDNGDNPFLARAAEPISAIPPP